MRQLTNPGLPKAATAVLRAGVNGVLDNCQRALDQEIRDWITRYRALADKYGLALVGHEGGQHLVGITGTDFTGATKVTIGQVPVKSFAVLSNTQLRAVFPAQRAGTWVNVQVTTPGGPSFASDLTDFRYVAPARARWILGTCRRLS